MMTSAQFGMPFTPGVEGYRNVDPYSEAELRAIAHPEGFPDEENYRTEYVTSTDARHAANPLIKNGDQTSILATDAQVKKYHQLVTSGAAYPGTNGEEVARAMALLVYTDDKNFYNPSGDHTSAYQFINNVLKGNANKRTMMFFMMKDENLMRAWWANKFSIRELLEEAKTHAKYAVDGLEILPPVVNTNVYRGYRSDTLPYVGEVIDEHKLTSMSLSKDVSTIFANKPDSRGRYHILCTMRSFQGRSLGQGSMAGPHEQEVLFAPTQRFEVTSAPRPWADGGPEGYEVDLGEM